MSKDSTQFDPKKTIRTAYEGSPASDTQGTIMDSFRQFSPPVEKVEKRPESALDSFSTGTLSSSKIMGSRQLADSFVNSKNSEADKNTLVMATFIQCLREELPVLENFDNLRDSQGELIIISCIKDQSANSLEALKKLIEIGVKLDVSIGGKSLLDYAKESNPPAYDLLKKAQENKSKDSASVDQKPKITLTDKDKLTIAELLEKDLEKNFRPRSTASRQDYFTKCEEVLTQMGTSIKELLNLPSSHTIHKLSIVSDFMTINKLIELGADHNKKGTIPPYSGKTPAEFAQDQLDNAQGKKELKTLVLVPLNIGLLGIIEGRRESTNQSLSKEQEFQISEKLQRNLRKVLPKSSKNNLFAQQFMKCFSDSKSSNNNIELETIVKNLTTFEKNIRDENKSYDGKSLPKIEQDLMDLRAQQASKTPTTGGEKTGDSPNSFLGKIGSYINMTLKWLGKFFLKNNSTSEIPVQGKTPKELEKRREFFNKKIVMRNRKMKTDKDKEI